MDTQIQENTSTFGEYPGKSATCKAFRCISGYCRKEDTAPRASLTNEFFDESVAIGGLPARNEFVKTRCSPLLGKPRPSDNSGVF